MTHTALAWRIFALVAFNHWESEKVLKSVRYADGLLGGTTETFLATIYRSLSSFIDRGIIIVATALSWRRIPISCVSWAFTQTSQSLHRESAADYASHIALALGAMICTAKVQGRTPYDALPADHSNVPASGCPRSTPAENG